MRRKYRFIKIRFYVFDSLSPSNALVYDAPVFNQSEKYILGYYQRLYRVRSQSKL